MAAAIKQELGFESELIEGQNGIFDVAARDVLVFSKHETGRFPDHDEVVDALRSAASAAR